MKSSSKLKILLDSTYLLPILGIEVEGTDKALVTLRRLWSSRMLEVYYTPFNILEVLGKVSKTRYDPDIVYAGLTIVKDEFKLTHPTVRGI